jgi:hypothetical protein
MAEKPEQYWDHREAAWIAYPAPEPVVVPAQVARTEEMPRLSDTAEGDVRSG